VTQQHHELDQALKPQEKLHERRDRVEEQLVTACALVARLEGAVQRQEQEARCEGGWRAACERQECN
jgi:tellurite resistance protein